MRSIVRHDTGESYQQFLTRLAKESGRRLGQSARTRCEDHELQGSGSRPSRMQRKRDGAASLGPHSRYRREPGLSNSPDILHLLLPSSSTPPPSASAATQGRTR